MYGKTARAITAATKILVGAVRVMPKGFNIVDEVDVSEADEGKLLVGIEVTISEAAVLRACLSLAEVASSSSAVDFFGEGRVTLYPEYSQVEFKNKIEDSTVEGEHWSCRHCVTSRDSQESFKLQNDTALTHPRTQAGGNFECVVFIKERNNMNKRTWESIISK